MIAAVSSGLFEAFPEGLHFEILNMTAEEDRVAVEATSRGLHASGKLYANHYHFLFHLRDGKIAVMKEFMDTELATEVLCGGRRP
jgi:ketosteroid isomerase-like protein